MSLENKEGLRPQGLEHQESHIPADWHFSDAHGADVSSGPSQLFSVTSMDPLCPHLSLEGLEAESPRDAMGHAGVSDGSSDGGAAAARAGEIAVVPAGPSVWQEAAPQLRLALWLALLWAGYGFQRGLCSAGLPYDCDPEVRASDVFTSLALLGFLGGALAWLAGVTTPRRFNWLFSWRRAYLWVLYVAVFPAYSGVASIPAFHLSLSNTSDWASVLLIAVVGVILLAAIGFHIWLALRGEDDGGSRRAVTFAAPPAGPPALVPDSPSGCSAGSMDSTVSASFAASLKSFASKASPKASPRRGGSRRPAPKGSRRRALALYLTPRLAIILYFAIWFAVLPSSGSFSLHLHHYALGWAVASFATFNHPVSGVALAFGTAIFVQGAGAYGFDPLLTYTGPTDGLGCLDVSSNTTGQMTCAFWSDRPFNLSFCSNESWIPWFDCNVEWPWPETKVYPGGNSARVAKMLTGGAGSAQVDLARLAAAMAKSG